MIGFERYTGSDFMGLPTDDNHLVYRWLDDRCNILFSGAKQGEALSSHFASDKAGLRYIKNAIDDWCHFVNWNFPWAKMVLAKVNRESVKRILPKVGFSLVYTSNNRCLYIRRLRRWDLSEIL